jgi:hypothetical protein
VKAGHALQARLVNLVLPVGLAIGLIPVIWKIGSTTCNSQMEGLADFWLPVAAGFLVGYAGSYLMRNRSPRARTITVAVFALLTFGFEALIGLGSMADTHYCPS